jgi:hypothetical protein
MTFVDQHEGYMTLEGGKELELRRRSGASRGAPQRIQHLVGHDEHGLGEVHLAILAEQDSFLLSRSSEADHFVVPRKFENFLRHLWRGRLEMVEKAVMDIDCQLIAKSRARSENESTADLGKAARQRGDNGCLSAARRHMDEVCAGGRALVEARDVLANSAHRIFLIGP